MSSFNSLLIVPFGGQMKNIEKLFTYFLYLAPNIESKQSKKNIKRIS